MYPLYGVTLGTKVYPFGTVPTEGSDKASVLNINVSKMVKQEKAHMYMSGQSSYVYKDRINEGSFGVSGSYGVSGISQFKSSLAAYAGNAVARSSKSISVDYSAISVVGVQYIDFENLNVGSFLESLKSSPKDLCIDVLDAYNNVIKAAGNLDVDILSALKDPDDYKDFIELVNIWIERSNTFCQKHGDGIVVEVTWGAISCVQMTMTAKEKANSWQYGGEANFSYANPVASINVKTTYAGSNSSNDAKVNVEWQSFWIGSKLEHQTNDWVGKLAGKSYQALAEVDVVTKAPSMTIKDTPKIPDFVEPPVSSNLIDKIDKIKDLEGLEALAKAQAYEQAKAKDKTLTLTEFLNQTDEPSNTSGISKTIDDIKNNNVNTLASEGKIESKRDGEHHSLQVLSCSASGSSATADSVGTSDFLNIEGCVPLGVQIANWADLFPWLARGFYNNVEDFKEIESLQLRVMVQDLLTLSKIYYIADNCGITEIARKDTSKPSTKSSQLADAFANGAAKLQQPNADRQKVYKELGKDAGAIYSLWNEVGFLRNCELGLGLIKGDKSVSEKLSGTSERQSYSLESCLFDFESANYHAFSDYYSLLPLITPDQDIWIFGPEQGGLSSIYDNEVVFSKPNKKIKYLSFVCDKTRKVLSAQDGKVTCYPIPFSAAEGDIEWKGMSVSSNVSSQQGLLQNLTELQKRLNLFNAWSFSSSNWPTDWTPKKAYNQKDITKHYIGLI
ncbi:MULTISPECIES: hypothetical protein [Pseudoalteromonas]|uniref:MACPF domain-containing protein n=1 Tax=Pseudoalteromonas amylolytica TaxID=1859457 RepID=A0A1S1MZL5_9GAMM|nr:MULTISPECIES: hypothetical protein [Pseudoalteromonas]OHU90547.1 hypothetical protein BFC16_02770 [Pseudoalteromonas sp. JW3]OHU92831.1 hypothetical protein BET10_05125 [Pseudoalteromonas amylolytica]